LVATLLALFWTLFITTRWQLLTVSVITALVVVVAAHLFSRRDNALGAPVKSDESRLP